MTGSRSRRLGDHVCVYVERVVFYSTYYYFYMFMHFLYYFVDVVLIFAICFMLLNIKRRSRRSGHMYSYYSSQVNYIQTCWQEKEKAAEATRKEKEQKKQEKNLKRALDDPNVIKVSTTKVVGIVDEESSDSSSDSSGEESSEEEKTEVPEGLIETLADLGPAAGLPKMELSKSGRKKLIDEQKAIEASIEAGTAAKARAGRASPKQRTASDVTSTTTSPGEAGSSKKKSRISDEATSTTSKPKAKPAPAAKKADLKAAMSALASRSKKG